MVISEDAKKFGWTIPEGRITFNWQELIKGVQDHIASLNWGYRVQLRERSVCFSMYFRFLKSIFNWYIRYGLLKSRVYHNENNWTIFFSEIHFFLFS